MKSTLSVALRVCASGALALGIISCASSSKNSGGGSSVSGYQLKPYEEKVLANGLRVLLIRDESLPSFSFHAVVKTGGVQDPIGKSGLSSFTEALVSKEPAGKSVMQFSESLGQLGARLDGVADADYTYFSASTLSKNQVRLMDLLAEALLTPKFSEAETERHRKQVIAALESRVDDPSGFASELFQIYTYGAHPYSRLNIGNERDVKTISRSDIVKYYQKYYRPNNTILAVVGRLNENVIADIERLFGNWKQGPQESPNFPQVKESTSRGIRFVQKPGMVQAQIRIGHMGIKRNHPDYVAARVGMTILGGGFSSRLMDRIRDNLGLTYGISSSLDGRLDRGLFEVETFTGNRGVGQIISEATSLVKEFSEKGISDEELNRAKGYMSGRFPQAIETGEKLAFNLLLLRVYGIPDSYLSDFQKNLAKVTVSDVNRTMKEVLHPERLQILVYGNGDDILPQLELLGPTEVRKASEFRVQ